MKWTDWIAVIAGFIGICIATNKLKEAAERSVIVKVLVYGSLLIASASAMNASWK